jgi:O-succinylbenzoic acid--CoA ligase
MPDTPTDWLDHTARVHGGNLAVTDGARELNYEQLRAAAGAVAGTLADAGLGPGDPVAIDLPAGVDHAIALHGAILAGTVAQSMPPAGREGVTVAEGAGWLTAETMERAAGGPDVPAVHRRPAAPLTRVLSSGTSGEPKPVELTAANHLWSALASGLNLGVERGDRWLCCMPLNHVGGLTILMRSAIYGTAAVIHDGFDLDRVGSVFERGEASVVSLVSTQLVRLLDAEAAIDSPRLILLGGGPVPLDLLEEALGRGATVVQTYGLTEACSQVCTLAPDEARSHSGSAGRPLLGVEVRVEEEQVLVRGPNVAPASRDAEGWLHTGDLGRLDDHGYLWVEGRRGDLIVTGGENVRPERVEEVLRRHPGVADVGVAGVDDREWGQAVVAYAVRIPGSDASEDDVLALAREGLKRHEVPKRVEFVGELPRTPSGKLQRRLLGSLYAGAPRTRPDQDRKDFDD